MNKRKHVLEYLYCTIDFSFYANYLHVAKSFLLGLCYWDSFSEDRFGDTGGLLNGSFNFVIV